MLPLFSLSLRKAKWITEVPWRLKFEPRHVRFQDQLHMVFFIRKANAQLHRGGDSALKPRLIAPTPANLSSPAWVPNP